MEKKVKKTVGEAALDLQKSSGSENHTVIDQTRSQISEYQNELIKCVNDNKKSLIGDFYVVVITKKEKLLENVLRNYFLARVSCPTPDYDQAVFRYDSKREEITFLWVIPDKETCLLFLNNSNIIDKEEQQLLGFIQDFSSGRLFKLAKQLNNEKMDSIELEN